MPDRSSSCGVLSVPAATTTTPASTRWLAPSASTYSTPRASPSSITTRSTFAPARNSRLPVDPGVVDVGVERRLAGVRRATLQARAAAHAVRVGIGAHRLEMRAERAKARLDRVHALLPIGALTHAEAGLDPVVVRVEVGGAEGAPAGSDEPARGVPLGVVVVGDAERDLRVHRRRATDAAGTEHRDDPPSAAVDRGKADRPPEVVIRLRLPAGEVCRRAVRAALEEQDRATTVGEFPATTPPPAPDPTTTTSNRSVMRSQGTTSPWRAGSRAAC